MSNYDESLNTFFVELGKSIRVEEGAYTKAYNNSLITFFDEVGFRLTLYRQFKRQSDKYLSEDFNVLDLICPDENSLSDIVGDILNKNGTHGQADLFIKQFLDYLGNTKKLDVPVDEYKVHREFYANGRIDIYLESNTFAIIIENKPFAYDQKDQLKRYYDEIARKYKDRLAVIYLSKNSDDPTPYSIDEDTLQALYSRKRFLALAYFDFAKEFLESCHQRCESNKFRFFLRDLISYIETHPAFADYTIR